jgi:dihydrofolate reductase
MSRKVKLYISMSVDGFLATSDDDLSWLSKVERPGEDYGYAAFTATVDTYLVGRRTYDKVVEMVGSLPQAESWQCYVLTRQEIPDQPNLEFYRGDIEVLIQRLKSEEGKGIYCDGGGQVVQLLMEKNLIDEYIISVIPLMLGEGKRLFLGGVPSLDLQLKQVNTFPSGLVQLHYVRE